MIEGMTLELASLLLLFWLKYNHIQIEDVFAFALSCNAANELIALSWHCQ